MEAPKTYLSKFYEAVKPYALKLYTASPFAAGIAVGYFGRPLAQPLVSLAIGAVKTLLKF